MNGTLSYLKVIIIQPYNPPLQVKNKKINVWSPPALDRRTDNWTSMQEKVD